MPQSTETIQLLHPEGKKGPKINRQTFELFEKAILKVLEDSNQLSFTQLSKAVSDLFKKTKVDFTGSVSWFAVSVKLHLEAIGVIDSFMEKGKKMHKLSQRK